LDETSVRQAKNYSLFFSGLYCLISVIKGYILSIPSFLTIAVLTQYPPIRLLHHRMKQVFTKPLRTPVHETQRTYLCLYLIWPFSSICLSHASPSWTPLSLVPVITYLAFLLLLWGFLFSVHPQKAFFSSLCPLNIIFCSFTFNLFSRSIFFLYR
jgi:hypothetical protein